MTLSFDQTDEEKKKRKLSLLNEIGNLMPGAQRGQETGRLISEAYDKGGVMSAAGMGLRRAPGDIIVGAGDFLNKGIIQPTNRLLAPPINALADMGRTVFTGDVASATEKTPLVPLVSTDSTRQPSSSQKPITDSRETMPGRLQFGVNTVSKVPAINEIPSTQRDSELGKMNVSTNGNITTYDIGGNTLSYDSSQKNKTNLERINQRPAGSQPTWDDYHKQQKARYDAYVNSPRGRFFGATPLATEQPRDNSLGGLFMQGIQSRRDKAAAQESDAIAMQDIKRADLANMTDRNLIDMNKLSIDEEANRINEMNTISQNKLRDIQGQVALAPPIKENALKPMVVEEADPNDLTGTMKRQRIMIPNAEGTGYVDGMANQTFTESQPEIIERLLKMRNSKDPKLAAAEAKYKATFGNLPY